MLTPKEPVAKLCSVSRAYWNWVVALRRWRDASIKIIKIKAV